MDRRTAETGGGGGNLFLWRGHFCRVSLVRREQDPKLRDKGPAHTSLPQGPKWRLAWRRRRLVATRPAEPASSPELQLPDIPLQRDYSSRHAPRAGGSRPALHIPAGSGGSYQSAWPMLRGARPAVSGGSGAVTFPAGPPPEPLPERGPGWQRWEVGAGRRGSARCEGEGVLMNVSEPLY